MKTSLSLIFIVLFAFKAYAQDTIKVAVNTFKLKSHESDYYYAFSAGDKIEFTFYELKNKGIKELEIVEYASNSAIFKVYNTALVGKKIIDIPNTGIYKFVFKKPAFSSRVCQFIIKRIPKSKSTENFNTTVYWKTMYDTSHIVVPQIDKTTQKVIDKTVTVHSKLNSNGNKATCDFILPSGTVNWTYSISTKQPDDIAIYLASREDGIKFLTTNEFHYYKEIQTYTGSTQMSSPLEGNYSFCIKNNNTFTAIDIKIAVIANIVTVTKVPKTVVHSYQVPYLKN